eukprot:TRINITY_DN6043_c0_g1_i1.p1 TRINITY_DN6043_c0_g1~~TRINITY_DN6043_c0_g1_i1.p1  ORF type:complete len:366 (-),score=98.20 TRINITY_DN6043_c0_g1_i1:24-1121(-)
MAEVAEKSEVQLEDGAEKSGPSWHKQLMHHVQEGEQESERVGRSQRRVRTPKRLDLDEKLYSSTLEWKPMPGKGMTLSSIKWVNEMLKQYKSAKDPFLKDVHVLLYNRPGRERFRKRDILRFSGVNEANDTARRADNVFRASKISLKQLRKIAHVFGLRTLGDKKDLVNSIVDFIEEPYGEGYQKGEAPASSESEEEGGEGVSDDDAIQALDTLARGGDAKKDDKKKRKRSDLDDDDAPLTLVAPGPSKRQKKEEEEEERPSILAHSKKKPTAPAVPDKPPARKPGRPRKSELPPVVDMPKPKLTPEQRLIRSKLEEFVRAIAGKAGYRLKSDVLVGYVYGTLGMDFARENMDVIARTVSEYLGR